jgi:hypothetical protein
MKIINALFVALLLTGILGFSTAAVMADEDRYEQIGTPFTSEEE